MYHIFNRWRAVCETATGTISYFFWWIWLAVLCCSQYLLISCLYTYLYVFPFLSLSMLFVSRNFVCYVWETAHHWLCDFFTLPLSSIPQVSVQEVQSGLYVIITISEKCMYNWMWPQHGMCKGSDKTKKFTHCTFSLNETFWLFLHVLY
jgi:hypothetical protein